MFKEILRKKLINIRKNNYRQKSIKYSLLKETIENFKFFKTKIIGAYYPINYEVDCLEVLKKLEETGHKISLPVTKKKNQMEFFEWSFKEPLQVGKMGIPEPSKLKKVYPDIILVPLVGYDKYNYRLGYGGGYYDRYIQKIKKIKKTLTVGIAFSFQKVNKLKVSNHDKKLNFVLTEKHN